MQALLGEPITASTIFDQCEKVADALNPVFRAIKLAGAQASLFYFDDTPNRILQQGPVEKTRGGKTRLRTGIYSSACLAILSELADESLSLELMNPTRRIVLFQTNVGHAGEWMEEILAGRAATLGPPILMSDALSSNQIHDIRSLTRFATLTIWSRFLSRVVPKNEASHYDVIEVCTQDKNRLTMTQKGQNIRFQAPCSRSCWFYPCCFPERLQRIPLHF